MSMLRQRSQAVAQEAAQRKSQSVFLPAPVKGLNTVDPPGLMTPDYALALSNFLPLQNGLVTRGGSVPWAAHMPAPVESLMAWTAGGAEGFFAVAGGKIYAMPAAADASSAPPAVHSGLSSSRLQYVNFSNNGGSWLWACNGVDAPRMYNGTSWQTAAITGLEGNAQPVQVAVFQNRLFFCVPQSSVLYYLGTDAIQGAASPLPLGAYFDRGGEISLMANVTVDGGYGPDDYLVVISSEGEIVSFKGRNPDSASTWAMVGRFQTARPLGRRSAVKWGGDVVIMTEHGVAGISQMLSNELAGLVNAATAKIQPTWAEQTRGNYSKEGWDICVYHRRGLMLINAPDEYVGARQWVLNPTTVAWGSLTGWEQTRCLLEFKGQLFAGMNGFVQWLDVFTKDTFPQAGGVLSAAPVVARVEQAFVQPGGGGVKKRYTLMRPYITSQGQPEAHMGLSVDNVQSPYAVSKIMEPDYMGGSEWYTAQWQEDEWAVLSVSMPSLRTRWANAQGTGYSASVIVEIKAENAECTYTGADLQYLVSNSL